MMKISPVYAFRFTESLQVYSHLSFNHQSMLGCQDRTGACGALQEWREEVGLDTPGPQGLSRDGAGLQARLRFNAVSCNDDVNN